jgi:hypothetical protein
MALIPKFHILAAHYPVASGQEIVAGQWVKLNANGEVEKAEGASGELVIGVAGDTKSYRYSGLPETNDAGIGGGGTFDVNGNPVPATLTDAAFQTRVSDGFDETKASGRMTVYHSGGVFASNEFDTASGGIGVNDPLYVNASGNLTKTPGFQIVAYCTVAPGPYESGVPGTDINGSMSLGSYLEFKMVV